MATFSTVWTTYREYSTACKCKGETTHLTQSTKEKDSCRSSSRSDLAVLSQAFPCSLFHRPGQACQWAPGTPALLVKDAPSALPPLTAHVADNPMPHCHCRSCSWNYFRSYLWSKTYKSVMSSHVNELLFPAQRIFNLHLVVELMPLNIIVCKIRASAQPILNVGYM